MRGNTLYHSTDSGILVKMAFRLYSVLLIFLQALMVDGQGTNCNAELKATEHYLSTQSPGFPTDYQNGLHCVTHITADDQTKAIELMIVSFNLEDSDDCYKDVLAVYDGVDEGMRLVQHSCGQHWAWPHFPEKVITTGPEVTIVFITDGDTVEKGYKILFRVVDPDPGMIFVAAPDVNRIHAIHRHSAINFRVQPLGLVSPQAVDYDPIGEHVYYTDKGAMTIGRVHLSEQRTDILHEKAITDPFGLRVDIVNRLLYWTDAVAQTISVSDLNGTQRVTIIADGMDKPGAIVVEPDRGYIYFTDWGYPAKIEKAEADGENRISIVTEAVSSPQGLAIDLAERALYWVDTLLDTLERSDLDGGNRLKFGPFHETDFFSIALDSEGFFITDEELGSIDLLDRSGTPVSVNRFRVYLGSIREPRGITLRPRYVTEDIVPYTCPRVDCSGLCIPKPLDRHVCKSVLPRLVNSCPEDIYRIQPNNRIDWTEPIASSPLDLPVAVTSTHSPGLFESGIYEVVYSFDDSIGNKITCNFTITLIDRYRLICPDDISVTVGRGATQTTVTWTPPRGLDGELVTDGTHNPGDSFLIGVTTVMYQAMFDNNQQSCSFTVTVREGDNEGPTFTNCPGNTTQWVPDGFTSIVLNIDDISLEDPNDIIVVNPFDFDSELYLGQNRINIQAEDREGNTEWCNFTVSVKVDTIKPIIVGCPDDITVTAKGDAAEVTWRRPVATDNSGSVNLESNHNPGDSFLVGAEAVSYTASDLYGNVESCSFVVTVEAGNVEVNVEVSNRGGLDSKPSDDSLLFAVVGGVLGTLMFIIIILLIVLGMRCRRRNPYPLIQESPPPNYDYPNTTVAQVSGNVNPALAIGSDTVRYNAAVDSGGLPVYDTVPVPPPTYRELQVNIADEIKKSIPPDDDH